MSRELGFEEVDYVDRVLVSDESANGDPNSWASVRNLFTSVDADILNSGDAVAGRVLTTDGNRRICMGRTYRGWW